MADETPLPHAAPTLGDGRVELRALTEADLPALVEQSRDPASVRWTGAGMSWWKNPLPTA